MVTVPEKTKLVYRFKRKPFTHQKEGIKFLRKVKSGALFWSPGTGKSQAAIDYIGTLVLEQKVKAAVIICPLSAAGVWVREIEANLPIDIKRNVYNLAGMGQKLSSIFRDCKIQNDTIDWYILNYEALWMHISTIEKHLLRYGGSKGDMTLKRGPWNRPRTGWEGPNFLEALRHVEYTSGTVPIAVIVDEAHKIKHHTSNRSKACHELAKLTEYRVALTGTPITNTPLNAFSEFKFIDPSVYGLHWISFKNYYAVLGGWMNKQVIRYTRLEDFKRRLHEKGQVVKKEDCLDLPEKTYEIIPIKLEEKTKKIYQDMARQLVTEAEEYIEEAEKRGESFRATATIVLTKLLRLSQITSGFVTDTEGVVRRISTEKLNVATEMIENLVEQNEKIVVFYRFRQNIKDLEEALTSKGIILGRIDGSIKAADRDNYIERFQDRNNPLMVILCQLDSGSLSITLTRARTVIFYNLDNSMDNYTQAQDRIHRIGQESPVTYYHLQVKGSIDQEIYEALKGHIDLADMLLKRPRRLLDKMSEM